MDDMLSPLYRHAADALNRARKLPVGPHRNDLRQLAVGLRWLQKKGRGANAERRIEELGLCSQRRSEA